MSKLAATIATAEAMLSAGNTASAKRHAKKALKEDPNNLEAFHVLFQVTLRENLKAGLRLAEERLARDPQSPELQIFYFVALLKNRKKRPAAKVLDSLSEALSRDPEMVDGFKLMYSQTFGDPDKTRKAVKDFREKHQDEDHLDHVDMIARFHSEKVLGTAKAARKVLEKNPSDPIAHFILSIESFKTLRFRRARKHAREMARAKPEKTPLAKEIIFLSYLVYLPPFFLAHIGALMIRIGVGWLGWVMIFGGYMLGIVFFIMFHAPATLLYPLLPAENFFQVWYGMIVFWMLFQFFGFTKIGNFLSGRRGNVALNPGY